MCRILLLLLLFCIYVCNARPIRVTGWLQLSGKLSFLELQDSYTLKYEEKGGAVDEGKVTLLNSLRSQAMGGKDGDALGRHNEGNKGNILPLASAENILETREVKDKRNHARVLRSKPGNTKESVDSKEDGTEEDIVVMDYAHPHRKPPIHNMTP